MRKQLDLDNLLSKYDNSVFYQQEYLSPTRQYPLKDSNYRKMLNNSPSVSQISNSKKVDSNFQMSKSECQQFLFRIRQELKKQEKTIDIYSDNVFKQLHQKFQKQHQNIRREILFLLQNCFQEHQKIVKAKLLKQREIQSLQFKQVKVKIMKYQEDIQRILFTLKSNEYRKGIAEIVLKDYNSQIDQLSNQILIAKDQYMNNLMGTEIDRSKIQCIKNDLQNLFIVNQKNQYNYSQPTHTFFQPPLNDKSSVSPYQNNETKLEQKGKKSFFGFCFDG